MRDFEVLERGNHYFRCYVDGSTNKHCRILIDENSQDLPLGHVKLHIEEITDRYQHFGHDAVFRLTLPYAEQGSIEIYTQNMGKRNAFTYRECVRLGGKWEPILNEWVFSKSLQDKVEQLAAIVKSEQVTVEVEFKETISQPQKQLTLFGFELIQGLNIDFTPRLHKGIIVKKGDISFISGANAKSIVRAGTVVRLQVPKSMVESPKFHEDYLAATNYKTVRRRASRRSY
ncbi:hypothetical protein [Vibrio agarivorans]|uniref:hypothetical protein n=1 Tax=Vibrio agarivorans TaxID=153622 RepID=UPI00222F41E3|nr:hypothetical protein [Vibrio agarivorans]